MDDKTAIELAQGYQDCYNECEQAKRLYGEGKICLGGLVDLVVSAGAKCSRMQDRVHLEDISKEMQKGQLSETDAQMIQAADNDVVSAAVNLVCGDNQKLGAFGDAFGNLTDAVGLRRRIRDNRGLPT